MTVLADSSVQRGSDVFKLLASGAKAVLVGRAMLYGAAAGRKAGAMRMMKILTDELALTMDMSGCRTIADINQDMIATPAG
jgi:isopentenyl diphosphate isomerase/L-lactate dehydrogenase-like FMN-dependent dehydrogenase